MTIDEYRKLLTHAHATKPRFVATVDTVVSPMAKLQSELQGLVAHFDLDTAVGVQLDCCGEWIGLSRRVDMPLQGIYFAWGVEDVGWSEGAWKSIFDPIDGAVSVPDETYRRMLTARVAFNRWNGSVPGAYAILQLLFKPDVVISIEDWQDMTFVIALAGGIVDATLRALLTHGLIAIKPAGVQIRYYAVPPVSGPLFVWGTPDGVVSDGAAGWGTGQWAEHIIPLS